MTRLLFLTLVFFSSQGLFAQKPNDQYHLVWSDEFNYEGAPSSQNWVFEKGFVRNNEIQYYQASNAYCSNGILTIEAKREKDKLNPDFDTNAHDWRKKRQYIEYTSASINTNNLHSWQYGRFEMRGRFDTDPGLWPAWWTLGVSGQWPSNGEIDIMEYYKGNLLANIACGTSQAYKAEWFSNKFPIDSLSKEKWSSKFHIWRMDWDENAISLFVDDQLLNKVNLDKLINKDGTGINPFKQPHYMLLNLALGGDNGGDPSKTNFPKKFEIDYVRVYQK